MPTNDPMVILLMGVAGVGKTVVGSALADRLGWVFLDADDEHSMDNVQKMHASVSLTDADRADWLTGVRDRVAYHVGRGESVVLACSALKQAYRDYLSDVEARTEIVYLHASESVVGRRLRERRGHFAGPGLLPGQMLDLEAPADGLAIDATVPIDEVVRRIRAALGV